MYVYLCAFLNSRYTIRTHNNRSVIICSFFECASQLLYYYSEFLTNNLNRQNQEKKSQSVIRSILIVRVYTTLYQVPVVLTLVPAFS